MPEDDSCTRRWPDGQGQHTVQGTHSGLLLFFHNFQPQLPKCFMHTDNSPLAGGSSGVQSPIPVCCSDHEHFRRAWTRWGDGPLSSLPCLGRQPLQFKKKKKLVGRRLTSKVNIFWEYLNLGSIYLVLFLPSFAINNQESSDLVENAIPNNFLNV